MNSIQKLHHQFNQWVTKENLSSVYTALTLKMYQNTIENFLHYLEIKHIAKLNDLDDTLLHPFIAYKPNKKPYAAASINQRIAALDLFFTWAYEQRYCRINPILSYKKAKLQPRTLNSRLTKLNNESLDILDDTEQKRLYDILGIDLWFSAYRDAAIIELILESGLYAEEIITLEINNLNIEKKRVYIRGEDKRERQVKMNKLSHLSFCKQWLKFRQQFLGKHEYPLVFFTQRLKPMTKALLYQQISSYLLKGNIHKSQKGPDLLRQTAIVTMLKSGLTIEEVQANIGHKHLLSLERYIK